MIQPARPGQADGGPTDWLSQESPILPAMMHELKRLGRRARQRLAWVVVLTSLLFAVPAYVVWFRKPAQIAVISMSFVPRNGVGYANREVRAYVESVLLSRQNLYGLIERLELVSGLEQRDLDGVVDMLRGLIAVEAFAQFEPEDAHGDQAPGARVRIEVSHPDAAMASRIADGILEIITTTEHARRLAQATVQRNADEDKRTILGVQRSGLSSRLAGLEQQLDLVNRRGTVGRQLVLEIALLREQIAGVDALAGDMLRLSSSDAYAAGLAANTASDLTVRDVVRPISGQHSRIGLQVGISMIALLGCLLVAAALLAAFDHRVDTPADLLRLGTIGLGVWRAPTTSNRSG